MENIYDVYENIKCYIDNREKIEKNIKNKKLKIYLLAIIINVLLFIILCIFS